MREARCTPPPAGEGWPGEACLLGGGAGKADTVLLGDSHAQIQLASLDSYGRKSGHRIVAVAYGSCPPLLGVKLYGRSRSIKCRRLIDQTARNLTRAGIKRIVLVARWALYAEGSRDDDDGGATVHLTEGPTSENPQVFAALLEKTVKTFTAQGLEVVIVGPIPEQTVDVMAAVARNRAWNQPLPPQRTLASFLERQRHVLPVLARLSRFPRVRVLYPHLEFCSAGICPYSEDGQPLYRDSNHLNATGIAKLNNIYPEIFGDVPLEKFAAH